MSGQKKKKREGDSHRVERSLGKHFVSEYCIYIVSELFAIKKWFERVIDSHRVERRGNFLCQNHLQLRSGLIE